MTITAHEMSAASQATGTIPCPACGSYYCPRFYGGVCPAMTSIIVVPPGWERYAPLSQPRGCICPPGSEKTCQGPLCPRRGAIVLSGGMSEGTAG